MGKILKRPENKASDILQTAISAKRSNVRQSEGKISCTVDFVHLGILISILS